MQLLEVVMVGEELVRASWSMQGAGSRELRAVALGEARSWMIAGDQQNRRWAM